MKKPSNRAGVISPFSLCKSSYPTAWLLFILAYNQPPGLSTPDHVNIAHGRGIIKPPVWGLGGLLFNHVVFWCHEKLI